MDFVSISELYDDVLAEAPGCPIYTARDKIRLAAIDFCKQTGVSVHTEELIDIDAECNIMPLPVPGASVRVWQVLYVKTTGFAGQVVPVSRRSMVERSAQWESLTGDYPHSYIRLNNKQIQIIPIPNQDLSEVMSIQCSYIPKRDATRLHAVLFDEYRDAITHGALARLLKMSKEEWYDRGEAAERAQFFQYCVNEARPLADKDFQTGPQVVQQRPFA